MTEPPPSPWSSTPHTPTAAPPRSASPTPGLDSSTSLPSASPTEAIAAAYERLAEGQPAAWIGIVSEDEAMARARRLEREGPRGRAFWGVPFAVKDNIDVAGMETTAACPAFAYTAESTAPAVRRLLDAGAILVGKTNLDQFATGLVGTRTPYGVCHSVLDPQRVAGGSSTGSAVAVAEGVVAFALGTDTAGSGRVPAAFNGIVGLKPTRGLISTEGVVPACRSFDCVSILARSIDDAATVLDVVASPGSLAASPHGVLDELATPHPHAAGVQDPPDGRWRLGVPPESTWGLGAEQAAAYVASVAGAAGVAGAATWADVQEIDPTPFLEAGRLLYEGAFVAERLTTIGPLLAQDPEAIDPTVRQVVARGLDYRAVDVFADLHRLADLRDGFRSIWDDADALLVPTVPDIPTLAAVDADPIGTNTALGRWTNGVNLLGLCAVTVPSARRPDGLPGSVTLVGPAGHDQAIALMAQHVMDGGARTSRLPTGRRPV